MEKKPFEKKFRFTEYLIMPNVIWAMFNLTFTLITL